MTTASPADRIRNAVSAAGRVAVAAVTGSDVLVSEEERGQRIAACFACAAYDDALAECGHCGCFIGLKSRLRTESCPARRWPGESPWYTKPT